MDRLKLGYVALVGGAMLAAACRGKTTSLKGGVLLACELFNYDTTGNLKSLATDGRPSAQGGELKLGGVWARAEGPVAATRVLSRFHSFDFERRN